MSLEIENVDQLAELLETLRRRDSNPDVRKEDIAHTERMKEREMVHQEKMRTLEHEERLRVLAAGQEDREIVLARTTAAGRIAVHVVLIMAAAAVIATWLAVRNDDPRSLRELLFVTWGTCGLVSLCAVVGGLFALRLRKALKPVGEEASPEEETQV